MGGSEQRKTRSIEILKSHGIPTIPHLPPLGDDIEFTPRSADEVLRRARARLAYFMRSQFDMEGVPPDRYRAAMDELQAWSDLSPSERETVDALEPTEQQSIDSAWGIEAGLALAWAIGLVQELPWPDGLCDLQATVNAIRRPPPPVLRPIGELLDQSDLLYRQHWACRQSVQIERRSVPKGLHPSVVVERRRALEWVIGAGSRVEWDEVDLST